MAAVDRTTFAERTAAVERHLNRVQDRLPAEPAELRPMSDTTDAVVHAYADLDLVRVHEAASAS